MKTLYLARHAKSDWNADANDDFSRPLSKRGINDAKKIGEALKLRDWKPEKIVCSNAIRTKQTCELLCNQAGFDFSSVVFEKRIYEASVITLLDVISEIPQAVNSLMLIGHNPGIEWLLLDLCKEVPAQHNGKIITTGNIVKIQLDDEWVKLHAAHGTLIDIIRPKSL